MFSSIFERAYLRLFTEVAMLHIGASGARPVIWRFLDITPYFAMAESRIPTFAMLVTSTTSHLACWSTCQALRRIAGPLSRRDISYGKGKSGLPRGLPARDSKHSRNDLVIRNGRSVDSRSTARYTPPYGQRNSSSDEADLAFFDPGRDSIHNPNAGLDVSSTRSERNSSYSPMNSHSRSSTPQDRPSLNYGQPSTRDRRPDVGDSADSEFKWKPPPSPPSQPSKTLGNAHNISIELNGKSHQFSSLGLRDLCQCPQCVDPSTKQKNFSTIDIPEDVEGTLLMNNNSRVRLSWKNDVPGCTADHCTEIGAPTLRRIRSEGAAVTTPANFNRVLWDAEMFARDVADVSYADYMENNEVLHTALKNLRTYGLMFLTDVPESELSVSKIAERIGPLKNTFYGSTWDVRSVPEAKNVAYTSSDLGFHMDLLYMKQPPHLQFLHCIRSSAAGGASLFTDSFRAATDLFRADMSAFMVLEKTHVNYHYNHPSMQYYQHNHPTIRMKRLQTENMHFNNVQRLAKSETYGAGTDGFDISALIDDMAWAPQFQAPFSLAPTTVTWAKSSGPRDMTEAYSERVRAWHTAAKKLGALFDKPEGIYERMLKPGECVIFDNRRVLHARKSFEVADAGKERWLRGAYVDKDPYLSKMRVLDQQLGTQD